MSPTKLQDSPTLWHHHVLEMPEVNIFLRPGRSQVWNWQKLVCNLKIWLCSWEISTNLHLNKQNEKYPCSYNDNYILFYCMDTYVSIVLECSYFKVLNNLVVRGKIRAILLHSTSILLSEPNDHHFFNLYYISHSVVNLMLSRFSVHRIIVFFSQWQAFAAYRSASSGPVGKYSPNNFDVQNNYLYNIFNFVKYW